MAKKSKDVEEGVTEEAGKGSLDDDVLPEEGEPVPQTEETDGNGDIADTAGQHGPMAPETAEAIREAEEKKAREKTRGGD